MAVIRTDPTCTDATETSAARSLERSRSRVKRALAALAASAVALLSVAGSASAASFGANPGSLGPIPDGSAPPPTCGAGAPLNVTFTVNGVTSPITNVAVSMTLDPAHTWVGDLSVGLVSPFGGLAHAIFSRTGALNATEAGYSSDVAGPYTFSDAAPASPSWWEAANLIAGTTIPSGNYRTSYPGGIGGPGGGNTLLLTPTLAAAPPNGTWTLIFRDRCQGDTGSVAAASLEVTGTSPPPAGPGTTPTSTSTSTGQRAAALKKCKKKKTSRARKKCKKKANLLPV